MHAPRELRRVVRRGRVVPGRVVLFWLAGCLVLLSSPWSGAGEHPVPDWLGGTPDTEVDACREPFFHFLLQDAGLNQGDSGGQMKKLARDRIANLANRVMALLATSSKERFTAELRYLYFPPGEGVVHYRFDMKRKDLIGWKEREDNCEHQGQAEN